MSSKRAAAEGNKELFFILLKLIAKYALSDEELVAYLEEKQKRILYYRLRYMKRQRYIKWQTNNYALTPKGRGVLSEREIWELTIPKPKTWDKKWRLVLFDIPKNRRKRRDVFRLRLKELGLSLYQDSVWVYPYPLKRIVQPIADFYMLSSCVSFAVAEKLTGEEQLKRYFKLS